MSVDHNFKKLIHEGGGGGGSITRVEELNQVAFTS